MTSNLRNENESLDLGFGSVVASESRKRLLNRNGTFNVARMGLSFLRSLTPYHSLLTMSWPRFLAFGTLLYLTANLMFALAYLLCGPGALQVSVDDGLNNNFLRAFFFSVETIATIGYGQISPVGIAANVIVTIESLVGLLGLALLTGLLFARFSRPTAAIIYSKSAIIAPYRGITAFEFRITNARSNQLFDLEAEVLFAKFENDGAKPIRRFYPLELERKKVTFFPLSWTVVHPITETSPLYGLTNEDLKSADAEFLILITGIDETFSQTVHSRSSYKHDEIIWNVRFADVFNRVTDNQILTIDVRKIDLIE